VFNRFPDVDFGHCKALGEEIEFSFTTYTQINPRPAASVPITTVNRCSVTQNSPSKRTTRSKQDRVQEKAHKEQNKAYEKALKSAQAANKKCAKAADCLKYVTAFVDPRLLDSIPSSGNILTQLQESGIKHCINLSPTSNSVFWKRETLHHYVNDSCMVESRSTTVEEEEALLVLSVKDFTAIAQSSASNFVSQALTSLNKTRLTLVVFGLNEYLRSQKLKNKQQFRQHCTGENATARGKNSNDEVQFTPSQIEELKVKLMLESQSSVWPVETSEELGKTIARITKAIAERPFKEERFEQQFDFYAADVSGGVKVSKDGQGLTRLWQEQIQQFSLAALETSQAIVSKYPSPLSLIQAYEKLKDAKEASLLLQDIPVRRHAGPLSTSRRVGPELSKKIHNYLTSKDGRNIL